MKTYAIKTREGYLARQGNCYWYEDKPVGWALFCDEQDAREIAISHCKIASTVVTVVTVGGGE